jgi:tripeptidyl-peptidase-1
MFQTEVHSYYNRNLNQTIVRAESYVIPEPLVDHITHVDHLMYFPAPSAPVFASVLTAGVSPTTPDVIKQTYGISNTVASSGKASQSVFAALGQSFSSGDLTKFQNTFNLNVRSVDEIIGPNTDWICAINRNSCAEANLDVQYMTGIAQEVTTYFWSISKYSSNPFADWVTQLNSAAEIPLVHSISYGGPEINDASFTSFNTEMQKLGVRGVTVTVASGDDGAVSNQVRSSTSYCAYSPSFPASCPYVTAVGATQGPEEGSEEIAESSDTGGLITTGGGFSTLFDVPSYQKEATSTYLNNVSPKPVSGYNAGGRGIPDVALLGHNYAIVDGGLTVAVSGTSASSPTFAAMISLINDARLAQGKSSLGFLNQALYSLPASTFNDVTKGNNKCSAGQPGNCCSQGYTASEGWDPLTGLGSPKFEALKEALVNL